MENTICYMEDTTVASGESYSRRSLLRKAVGAAGGAIALPYFVPASALGKSGAVAPSNRITVGCIGVGNQGTWDMRLMLALPDVQVVAVCDPYKSKRENAQRIVNEHYKQDGCAAYNDFHELIARKDIDVVQIATNDHWHVLCALAALRSGKDLYCEKMMGLTIAEDKALRAACRQHGTVFQFGTQQRSDARFRQAAELALNGRLGKVHTVKVSAPSGWNERTEPTWAPAPVPAGFDYDLWLGPAPWAPYTSNRCVSPKWPHISDYCIGYIGGWGIHHMDSAQWGMDELGGPIEIEASGVFPPNDGLCNNPLNWDATMRYASGVTLSFTSDGHPNWHGVRFEGDKGWVHVDRSQIRAEPASLLQETIGPDEIHLHVSNNHQADLIKAVKTRGRTVSHVETAVKSDITCHLTYIAVCLGRKLRWNPEKEEFVNDPEANARMSRVMRSPWHV
jgi:predicted dehydrogenase